jgi:hypothetical protein
VLVIDGIVGEELVGETVVLERELELVGVCVWLWPWEWVGRAA